MKIAIVGCFHGEFEQVYKKILENPGVDLLLCCGDLEAARTLSDRQCMVNPVQKLKGVFSKPSGKLGTFYKYYSGQLVAPVLTIVIGGELESSNYLQELPYGGWLCQNIFYLGYSGIIDVTDSNEKDVLTVGGLSGLFNKRFFPTNRTEKLPYDKEAKKSINFIRNMDKFRLESMLQGSVDIMLSHDWPNKIEGLDNYGAKEGSVGSQHVRNIMKKLVPKFWFSALFSTNRQSNFSTELHFENQITQFSALACTIKCQVEGDKMKIVDFKDQISGLGLKLKYNPQWLAILKSRNFKPCPIEDIENIFNGAYDVPENFETIGCEIVATFCLPDAQENPASKTVVTNEECTSVRAPQKLTSLVVTICQPDAQENPQTKEFCTKLGIKVPNLK